MPIQKDSITYSANHKNALRSVKFLSNSPLPTKGHFHNTLCFQRGHGLPPSVGGIQLFLKQSGFASDRSAPPLAPGLRRGVSNGAFDSPRCAEGKRQSIPVCVSKELTACPNYPKP